MKKIAIVLFVAAAALAGCGKKKAPDAPATPAGDTTGSAAPAGDTAGSGDAAGSAAAPDAAGGAGGGGM